MRGFGCLGFFVILLIPILYFFFTTPLSSLPWFFWLFTIVFLIALASFIFIEISFVNSNRNFARETTTIIDLNSQQVIRTEKLTNGKVRQSEIKLDEVNRVLIHCEEVGHSCVMFLDSKIQKPFEVNSSTPFELNQLQESGKRLGMLLNKPVILKWTESGKVISEEEI